jgi:hypothetical protein
VAHDGHDHHRSNSLAHDEHNHGSNTVVQRDRTNRYDSSPDKTRKGKDDHASSGHSAKPVSHLSSADYEMMRGRSSYSSSSSSSYSHSPSSGSSSSGSSGRGSSGSSSKSGSKSDDDKKKN